MPLSIELKLNRKVELTRRLSDSEAKAINEKLASLINVETRVRDDLVEDLKQARWNTSDAIQHEDMPFYALLAVQNELITDEQFATLLLYRSVKQLHNKIMVCALFPTAQESHLASRNQKLLERSILSTSTSPSLRLTAKEYKEFKEEMKKLPLSEQYFFVVENVTVIENVEFNKTFFRAFRDTNFKIFGEVDREPGTIVIPSLGMLQTYLVVKYGKQAVKINPVLGSSSEEDIRVNGLEDKRDYGLPFPKVPLSNYPDGIFAPGYLFSLHDGYHNVIASCTTSDERKLLIKTGDAIKKYFDDNPWILILQEFFLSTHAKIIYQYMDEDQISSVNALAAKIYDMEIDIYRPDTIVYGQGDSEARYWMTIGGMFSSIIKSLGISLQKETFEGVFVKIFDLMESHQRIRDLDSNFESFLNNLSNEWAGKLREIARLWRKRKLSATIIPRLNRQLELTRRISDTEAKAINAKLASLTNIADFIEDLTENLKYGCWSTGSAIHYVDMPYYALLAVQNKLIKPEQFATLLLHRSIIQSHDMISAYTLNATHQKDLSSVISAFDMLAHTIYKKSDIPSLRLTEKEYSVFTDEISKLPLSEQYFFVVPGSAREGIFEFFQRINFKIFGQLDESLRLIPSFGIMQAYLSVKFGQKAVKMNSVLGASSADDMKVNVFNKQYDVALHFPQVFLPSKEGPVSTPSYQLTLSNFYCGVLASCVPQEERILLFQTSEAIKNYLDDSRSILGKLLELYPKNIAEIICGYISESSVDDTPTVQAIMASFINAESLNYYRPDFGLCEKLDLQMMYWIIVGEIFSITALAFSLTPLTEKTLQVIFSKIFDLVSQSGRTREIESNFKGIRTILPTDTLPVLDKIAGLWQARSGFGLKKNQQEQGSSIHMTLI